MSTRKKSSVATTRPESGNQDWAECLYYHIAQDALGRAKQLTQAPAGNETEFERKKAVATAIVFTALCLEAFINREYHEHVSATAKKHFSHTTAKSASKEKRDTEVAKWQNLPRLLGGTARFDSNAEPFKTFEQLVVFRNTRLIHFLPSKEGSESLSAGQNAWAEEIGNVQLAERYFACIRAMVDELSRLTNGLTPPATSFEQPYVRRVWSSLSVPHEG